MNKMTKKDRFKKFTKDNADLIAATAYFTAAAGVVVGYVALVKKVTAEYNASVEKEMSWVKEQNDAGKMVAALNNGTYALFAIDTPYEIVEEI